MAEEEIARMRFLRKEYLSKDRIFDGHLPNDHSRCGITTSRLIPGFFVLWGGLAVLASVLMALEVLGYAKTGT